MRILPYLSLLPIYTYREDKTMAIDVTDIGSQRSSRLAGDVDTDITRKMMFIAGGALVLLVAIKLGFLNRVFP
jgi:hypothetical protein